MNDLITAYCDNCGAEILVNKCNHCQNCNDILCPDCICEKCESEN